MLSTIAKSCVSSARRASVGSIPAAPVRVPTLLSATNNNTISTASPPLGNELGQVRFRSNRSRRGLYNGKDVRSGNSLSFSMKANKRKFKPNVFIKRVYSETLDEMIRFHLTASTLRTIDKFGGLDNYLLRCKLIKEGEGLKAKNRILAKMKEQELEAKSESAHLEMK